jgi:hypothetical protein
MYEPGDRVKHPTFGAGMVLESELRSQGEQIHVDCWASANAALADGLLVYATSWDPLSVGTIAEAVASSTMP